MTLSVAVAAQPVASDGCGKTPVNEYVVDADCAPFGIPGDFAADYDPGGCGDLSKDAFGWFTATSDSTTIGIVPNNNADVGLQVFSGNCGSLTLVDCADINGPTGLEELTVFTVIGQPYIIRVQTYGPLDSIPSGELCVFQTPPPPVNSDPCSAILLPVTTLCNSVTAGTNASSVTSVGYPVPSCYFPGAGAGGDVWFKALVPPSGHLIIDTQSLIPFDGAMSLYTTNDCSDPAQFTEVGCDDDGSSTGNEMPKLDMCCLNAGDTAYVRFWAYYGEEEPFRICASSSTTTLPVEFLDVRADAHNGVVDVAWSTASEQNSDHFSVERGPDNTMFTSIGELPAAGDASSRIDYLFTDRSPLAGLAYYRIREVDRDGASTITSTVVAMANHRGRPTALFPNPATDRVTIAFNSLGAGEADIRLLDALGRSQLMNTVSVDRGDQTTDLDLEGLSPGCYTVRITLPMGEFAQGSCLVKR
jgi:hypothetical protein